MGKSGRVEDDWARARLTPALVTRALRSVMDPELGQPIVDLGLVYNVVVGAGNAVDVRLTLPHRHHPLVERIDEEIRAALRPFQHLGPVRVQLVWQPPWTPAMITPEARAALGWRY